jgi:membrane-bound metal-dependent hydrolase YbcI (DUF457 family)
MYRLKRLNISELLNRALSPLLGRSAESAMIGPHMPSPVGHLLAGAAVAWTLDLVPGQRAWRARSAAASWFERAGGKLTLVCALLAAAPDLDLLLKSHRTFTHSVGAVVFVALFAGAIAANAGRPIWRIGLMCGGAYATHLLLDWLGADGRPPYGLQALWPLSDEWYISGLNVFRQTARAYPFSIDAAWSNAITLVRELMILGPLVWGVWSIRKKTLTRLASEQARVDHPAQQRTWSVLGISESGLQHLEDGKADV